MIEKIHPELNYQWIVILPGMGCHGCIQKGEVFMRDNVENKKILFVLTKISSLKILQHKTGINTAAHSNIYIDRNEVFYLPTKNCIYPFIIHMDKGKIAELEFQSPHNIAAFRKLKDQILAH